MSCRIAIGRSVVALAKGNTFPTPMGRSFAVPWYGYPSVICEMMSSQMVFQLKLSLAGCDTRHHFYHCVALFIWDQVIHMSSTAAMPLDFTTVLFSGAPWGAPRATWTNSTALINLLCNGLSYNPVRRIIRFDLLWDTLPPWYGHGLSLPGYKHTVVGD